MQYLAGAGVGILGLVDADVLDASNLHRQPLYALADVGEPKAELAAARGGSAQSRGAASRRMRCASTPITRSP